ncbi:DUF6624 domain-containing protein [Chryseobacterium pennipullorum]|uniref:Uncharacterized protein n=1 Tax=Chryseobacterium pennipullorum TaxID=2258963 RepID=A0A3D9B1A2_9FLAO|nr:DUF6624 domain-containing protein [Chryseobacterium pennipullorum]REC47425.1 hypothetical protein DRF67_10280 [Chryseobacterium pennipullorum]
MNIELAKELTDLAAHDLSVREKLAAGGKLAGGYHPEMEEVHRANAKRLREVIDEIGFPTLSKVGKEGSDAAWLIIQHSIGEPDFMMACLRMMEENTEDINPVHKAYLYDRIMVFQSKPQKYGTQLIPEGIYPVENKERLNEEREKVGLPAISADELNKIPQSEDIAQIDNRDPAYNEWRCKVGWIV